MTNQNKQAVKVQPTNFQSQMRKQFNFANKENLGQKTDKSMLMQKFEDKLIK